MVRLTPQESLVKIDVNILAEIVSRSLNKQSEGLIRANFDVRLKIVDIRPYSSADCASCLAVFNSNAPEFFAPAERPDFAAFLDKPGAYFVIEHEDAIVGCGGYASATGDNRASLVWGMVHRSSHRLGLGRFLLMYRLREIGKLGDIRTVRLDTSQRVAEFYQRQGFRIVSVARDGYAPGLDRIEMEKKLTVCP